MGFVCKQTAVLVVRINNNDVLTAFLPFLLLYTTYVSWPDWLNFLCFLV